MYIPAKIKANLNRILQKSLLFSFLYFSILSFLFAQNASDSLFQQRKEMQDSLILSGYWESKVFLGGEGDIQIEKGRPYYWSSIDVYEGQLPIDIPLFRKLSRKIANQIELKKKVADYVKSNYHRKGYPLAKANLINQTGAKTNEKVF